MGEIKSMRTSVVCALLILSVIGALGDDRHEHDDSERHQRDHDQHERDLGDASGAEAEDVREARIKTQGMYDSDIRATRAFAALDDAMDGLNNDLSDSTSVPHKKGERSDKKLKPTVLLQEEDAGRHNLGESQEEATLDASTAGMFDADVRAARAFAALDDQMDTLKTDMATKGSSSTSLHTASVTSNDEPKSKDMGESDSDSDAHDVDEQDRRDRDDDEDRGDESLIQVASTKPASFGEVLANKLVMDDLQSSDSSLTDRAKMEASQWSNMNKLQDAEAEETKHDLAEAQDSVDEFNSDDNVLEVTELDEADAASKAKVKATTSLGEQLQQAETKQAKEYMAQAANKESAIIAHAQAKEKKMEAAAKSALMKDVKEVKKDEQDATWHMKKTPA